MVLPKSKYKIINDLLSYFSHIPVARYVSVTVTAIVMVMFSECTKAELKAETAMYMAKTEEEKNRRVELQIELVKCQGDYNLIRSTLDDLPIPAWLVEVNTHKAVYVNTAYVKVYLTPLGLTKFDILGTTGAHIFGQKAADEFARNNDWVRDNKRPLTSHEALENTPRQISVSTKFPVFRYGELTHIGGLSYETFN